MLGSLLSDINGNDIYGFDDHHGHDREQCGFDWHIGAAAPADPEGNGERCQWHAYEDADTRTEHRDCAAANGVCVGGGGEGGRNPQVN